MRFELPLLGLWLDAARLDALLLVERRPLVQLRVELRAVGTVLGLAPIQHVEPRALAVIVQHNVAIGNLLLHALLPQGKVAVGNRAADEAQEARLLLVALHRKGRVHARAVVGLHVTQALGRAILEPLLWRLGRQNLAQRLAAGHQVGLLGRRLDGRRGHQILRLAKRQNVWFALGGTALDERGTVVRDECHRERDTRDAKAALASVKVSARARGRGAQTRALSAASARLRRAAALVREARARTMAAAGATRRRTPT